MINKIHERALRIAYNNYILDFDSLLEKDNSVTIHQRNIQTLTLEIYKTLNNLNPDFTKEVFCFKPHKYPTKTQNLVYPNPRTVSYGLESFRYKANCLWSKLPTQIKKATDIATFKHNLSQLNINICNCNQCKDYVANLGYIESNPRIRPP